MNFRPNFFHFIFYMIFIQTTFCQAMFNIEQQQLKRNLKFALELNKIKIELIQAEQKQNKIERQIKERVLFQIQIQEISEQIKKDQIIIENAFTYNKVLSTIESMISQIELQEK